MMWPSKITALRIRFKQIVAGVWFPKFYTNHESRFARCPTVSCVKYNRVVSMNDDEHMSVSI